MVLKFINHVDVSNQSTRTLTPNPHVNIPGVNSNINKSLTVGTLNKPLATINFATLSSRLTGLPSNFASLTTPKPKAPLAPHFGTLSTATNATPRSPGTPDVARLNLPPVTITTPILNSLSPSLTAPKPKPNPDPYTHLTTTVLEPRQLIDPTAPRIHNISVHSSIANSNSVVFPRLDLNQHLFGEVPTFSVLPRQNLTGSTIGIRSVDSFISTGGLLNLPDFNIPTRPTAGTHLPIHHASTAPLVRPDLVTGDLHHAQNSIAPNTTRLFVESAITTTLIINQMGINQAGTLAAITSPTSPLNAQASNTRRENIRKEEEYRAETRVADNKKRERKTAEKRKKREKIAANRQIAQAELNQLTKTHESFNIYARNLNTARFAQNNGKFFYNGLTYATINVPPSLKKAAPAFS